MSNSLSQMRSTLEQSQAGLVEMLKGADNDAVQRLHGEEEWSIAVMLSHLTEARSYFVQQVEDFLKNPAVTVGRTLDNEQRVEAIINAQRTQVTREQLEQRLAQSYQAVRATLDHVIDAQLANACTHARLGAITLGEFIQKSIVDHDQAHLDQANSFLQS